MQVPPPPAGETGRNGRVLLGACSWAESTLVKDTTWYPRRGMKAAERIAYYATRFPLVEIDSTYRFPPTPDVARQWVERTPPGFTIDVRAWSLLSGQATMPASLWDDLQDEVRPEARDNQRLYAGNLSAEARAEAWRRFEHALRPLTDAGRLGCVVLQLPSWLKPGDTGRAIVTEARQRLTQLRLCVEFGNPKWLGGDQCEDTLAMLEELDVAVACVDFTGYPVVAASTADLAMVRFHGRHDDPELEPGVRAAWRFAHRYSHDELESWVPRIHELAASSSEVHVLFNNCWRDHAVGNAEEMGALLGIGSSGAPRRDP
jgi:uncharacterized protein YecE (DUF72 family)